MTETISQDLQVPNRTPVRTGVEDLLLESPKEIQIEAVIDADMGDLAAIAISYRALVQLPPEQREHALAYILFKLGIEHVTSAAGGEPPPDTSRTLAPNARSEDVPRPREFMAVKRPQSQAERVTCLAYYLTRYRSTERFSVADIGELNMEAAGQRFGNLPRDVKNADQSSGYIVTAGRGVRQLTSRGEALVEALPDRDAVKAALRDHPYRTRRSTVGKKSTEALEEE